jgi:hypothetical protein
MDASDERQSLAARCMLEQDTLAEVRGVLRTELRRSGLADVILPDQLQNCRLVRDPSDHTLPLIGEWRKSGGGKVGSVVIHENGQLFAELDVLMPCPTDTGLLVDAVVAWGRAGALKSELRLIEALC